MTYTDPHRPSASYDGSAKIEADSDDLSRLLGPIVAGARARGVADAFELMGLAAVLIDGSGRVLHAGGRAERTLLPLVRIVESHLVGFDAKTNVRLQTLIEAAVGAVSHSTALADFCDAAGCPRLSMKVMNFPDNGPVGTQLLRAIILVTEINHRV